MSAITDSIDELSKLFDQTDVEIVKLRLWKFFAEHLAKEHSDTASAIREGMLKEDIIRSTEAIRSGKVAILADALSEFRVETEKWK